MWVLLLWSVLHGCRHSPHMADEGQDWAHHVKAAAARPCAQELCWRPRNSLWLGMVMGPATAMVGVQQLRHWWYWWTLWVR